MVSDNNSDSQQDLDIMKPSHAQRQSASQLVLLLDGVQNMFRDEFPKLGFADWSPYGSLSDGGGYCFSYVQATDEGIKRDSVCVRISLHDQINCTSVVREQVIGALRDKVIQRYE
jgi:hypothetical protein